MTALTDNDWLNQQRLTLQEEGDCDTLIGLGLEDVNYAQCLKVLRKYGGDVSKAANALFEGERGGDAPPAYGDLREAVAQVVGPQPKPTKSLTEQSMVIDLTGEDEDGQLSRALQASLEDQGSTFRRTDRAPDPNWAVVPSNVAMNTNVSQDDQAMSQAIEASLNDDIVVETFEELPLEKRVRLGEAPVVLRPTRTSYVCSSLLLHGLFFVPQVRQTIAQWRPPIPEGQQNEQGVEIEISLPTSGSALVIWTILETYLNMDIARMTELNVDEQLRALKAVHWNSLSERPGQVAFDFYTQLAWIIEQSIAQQLATQPPTQRLERLFHFRHGFSDAEPNHGPFDPKLDVSVVNVDVGGGLLDPNDLISSLTQQLCSDISGRTTVIFEPSEVVAFRLLRHDTAGHGREKFRYPQHIYLDQFLRENVDIANEKRKLQKDLLADADRLQDRRAKLTRFNGRDVLKDLRSSLHYFENVAEDEGDAVRKNSICTMATKLRKVLERIESEIQNIDLTVSKYKSQAAAALDIAELQKYRYDLRVALVHDGLYGRNRVYSYVKQKARWWKIVDYAATPVSEETVLTDSNGLHLGAGPFLLIYSRALSEEEENASTPWPESQKNFVKHQNKMFFSSLPAEIAAKAEVEDPNSPPTSPYEAPTPSEYTMDSETAEPPSSRGEPMDISG